MVSNPSPNGAPTSAWKDGEVMDISLLDQAKKILSKHDQVDLESRRSRQHAGLDGSSIPYIKDLQAVPLPLATNSDLVIVSDSQSLTSSGSDNPSPEDVSAVSARFPNSRVMMFDVRPLVNAAGDTVSSEGARLYSRLVRLKATDIDSRSSIGLKNLLPENYRTIFVAKGIGATVVKECLLRSRGRNEPLETLLWESTRGIVCLNPIDGTVIAQMRQNNIPSGFWANLRAKWWTAQKKRISQMSSLIDEIEQVETDYREISPTAPPRFSLVQDNSTKKPPTATWKDFRTMTRGSATLDDCLQTWTTAQQTVPIAWPQSSSDGARLLSLDGGGVKGISSLLLLRAIMEKVAELESPTIEQADDESTPGSSSDDSGTKTNNTTTPQELSVVDYFDLVGGTSTGGLIGLMLCRLGMGTSDTIAAYNRMASKIFAPRLGPWNVQNFPAKDSIIGYWLGNFVLQVRFCLSKPRFDGKILEDVVDTLTKEKGEENGKGTVFLENTIPEGHCKTFMVSTRTDRTEAALFRSYTVPVPTMSITARNEAAASNEEDCNPQYTFPPLEVGFDDITIGDAARATSAAPSYFAPKIVHNVQFWDGGMLNNNPIDQVWDARDDADKPVSCIVSLGCSYPSQRTLGLFPLINFITQTTSYITNTEAKHRDFVRMIQRENVKRAENDKIQYFRLNVPTMRESVGLDDWKKMKDLVKYTEAYLETREAQDIVLRAAHALARPAQRTLFEVAKHTPPAAGRPPKSTGGDKTSSPLSSEPLPRSDAPATGTAEAPSTLKHKPYQVRIWSSSHKMYYQSKPFLDANSGTNVISERFAAAIDADARAGSSVAMDVLIFREGIENPEEKQLTFRVKEMGKNVLGDVLLGWDVRNGA